MYRVNPDCWVWTPTPPLCLRPRHSGSLASVVLTHQEEEEEEEEELAAVCCYAAGCDDVIGQAADAQRSTSEPASQPGVPGGFVPAGGGPGSLSSQQPNTVMDADGRDVSQHFQCSWEAPRMETQGCTCVYGRREPEVSCWPGSPYIYYGVRRNLVVGVEVVEEVAVEDTVEVITENLYTDDLLDPELLHDDQLYPT